MTPAQPNFDFVARPYRWLEYLTLGRALEHCRLHYLPSLLKRNRALILGDGERWPRDEPVGPAAAAAEGGAAPVKRCRALRRAEGGAY